MHDPLEQFRVYTILPLKIHGWDISLTNSSLWMLIVSFSFIVIAYFSTYSNHIIPTSLQVIAEKFVSTVETMTKNYLGDHHPYFPFVFCIFVFVALCNILGLIPYAFTVTSQIVVTFSLALLVFFISTGAGIVKHGFGFFSFFLPKQIPSIILPFLFIIEVLSYLFRPVSLAVRLFANMVAGHIMLKLFSGFSDIFGKFWGILPLGMNVILLGFEVFIALLQAYVFALLTCIYVRDALYLH